MPNNNNEWPQGRPLYQLLSRLVSAHHRCRDRLLVDWQEKHADEIEKLVCGLLPGLELGLRSSRGDKLVFQARDGSKVIVRATLADLFRIQAKTVDTRAIREQLLIYVV